MTMSNTCRKLSKGRFICGLLAAMGTLTSCDSAIFDYEGDCSVRYRLGFRYTKNILNADAFGPQVTDVNVALYDQDGKMVYSKSAHRDTTVENDFIMEFDDVLPGRYDIVAWCEGSSIGENAESFTLTGQEMGDALTASGAQIRLQESDGAYYSGRDLNRLYYGINRDVEFADTYGTVDLAPVYLTKDTNHITVQLMNMNGQPVDPSMIEFSLEGANSELDWQNLLAGNTLFTYTPWYVRSIYSDNPEYDNSESTRNTMADSQIPNGVQAEFTTSRIMAGKEQRLKVTLKETGEEILNIPMVEYLLLVRGYYEEATSPQDYLDRYDDFTMLFFIDEAYTWIKSRIFINNWRVVPPQDEKL